MRSAVILLGSGLCAAVVVSAPLAAAQPTAAAPVAAQVLASATPVPLQLSNTVHCVFDMMPAEDREMTMLLLENEILTSGEFQPESANVKVIDRLTGDAQAKCVAAFSWSKGRSAAAKDFAMSALFADGLGQFIELIGRATKPIEGYFADHKQQLTGSRSVRGVTALRFKAFLIEQGWDADNKDRLGIGVSYLETLMARDSYAQDFAAAPLHAAPVRAAAKPVVRVNRPKRARRGTP